MTVMDAGSGLEAMVRVLSFAADNEMVVVRLVECAASVCGVLFIVTVIAEDDAAANVTSSV